MIKEELFNEFAIKYQDYLYGRASWGDVYKIEEAINSLVYNEVTSVEEIEGIVKENLAKINKIEEEVKAIYDREIADSLADELVDLLKFRGVLKSAQYKKRAEELKEKLQKYDGLSLIRERALQKFFLTQESSKYNEQDKIRLILRLGALDTKNL